MNSSLWQSVDAYLSEALLPVDPVLEAVKDANTQAGLPAIDVSALQGEFLHLLAKVQGARRILEIGTLGGYSTIWLARAMPADGRLITLEAEPKHVRMAQQNIAAAGLASSVEIIEGKALESLTKLRDRRAGPFDFIFIDADKVNTAEYFRWALDLARSGTVIVVDNVVRKGEVANPATDDSAVLGMRRFIALVANEPRVEATALQTVGAKGYDGFVLARVR